MRPPPLPDPFARQDATDLLPLIMEVVDLRPPERDPTFDLLALGPGEPPLVVAPRTTGDRLRALCAHHAVGFACGAIVTALAARLL